MNGKLKKIFTNTRVVILLVVILLALFAIYPNPFQKGVAIRSVARNSSASELIENPKPGAAPMSKEVIVAINSLPVENIDDYYDILKNIPANGTVNIKTNRGFYRFEVENALELGLSVYNAPKTNIRLGLDLQGGTRVLLQPEEQLEASQMESLISNMKERLNVFGLSDIVVRSAGDLSGNQFILVEIAGASEEEVSDLLAKQGKFEAKIGNRTVFKGGDDITYVCRTAECSGIDTSRGCTQVEGGYTCRFQFSISLSPAAADRQAELTKNLEVVTQNGQPYLNETLNLFLDDQEVDQLFIGADLKGRATTEVAISGSGTGVSQTRAIEDALSGMKRLQTILITGSLPVKLEIVKMDAISPALGQEFAQNTMFVGVLAVFAVALVVLIRYRRLAIIIPILVITWLEIFLLIAIAALIGWNLDVASIAGIFIAIGTGLDDQIIITDETLKGGTEAYAWKQKIKKAFFIVFAAYFTTIGSMIPLLFAGAGLLKGFAVTTIIGVTLGVFITRPAYANIIEILLKD